MFKSGFSLDEMAYNMSGSKRMIVKNELGDSQDIMTGMNEYSDLKQWAIIR